MDEEHATIDAGALSFTMRFRDDIPGDAGLSIEVHASVDGRETELLRFDCFAHAPHYHYGPAAGDEQIMFDATASGDPLQWTLDRFEQGRLKPMIERAGYAGVAAAVDDAFVTSVLPSLISQAWAMADEHAS
jgi:hypothetical protein